MPKNPMGRKSHHVQDQQFKQNISGLPDDIPTNQPTRTTVGKQQSTKSSKEEPRGTK